MRRVRVGFACDNACLFCAQGRLRDAETERVDVRAALDEIQNGETIAFVGGEPTLCDDLATWIAMARERGARRIVVQTNGRRLSRERLAQTLADAASGALGLDVSLHGSSAEMHDYHSSIQGSFDETTAGIRAAVASRSEVGITVVVTRSNFRHLVEIVDLAAALGARAVHFAGVEPLGSARAIRERLIPHAEMVAPHLARAAAAAKKRGLGVVAASVADPLEARDRFAGIGDVEAAPSIESPRPRLPILGRPVPGRSEEHGVERKTGAALETLFPELFRAESGQANLRSGRG